MQGGASFFDCSDVCDASFVPSSAGETALFNEKQSFICLVLNKVVQTDRGKTFVWEHEDDHDAQRSVQTW